MRSKKVSVIIPVYNAEKYIEECLQSIIHQNELGEAIVVDDASTDRTNEIVANLAQKHPKIKLLKHPNGKNLGPGMSRNLGLQEAKEDFVNFLDADDHCLEKRFEWSLAYLEENTDIHGIYESIKVIKSDGSKLNSSEDDYAMQKEVQPKDALESIVLNTQGTVQLGGFIYKRAFLSENKIAFTNHWVGEDLNVIFQACIKGKIFLSKGPYRMIRKMHDENLSQNLDQKQKDLKEISKMWKGWITQHNFSKPTNRYFVKQFLKYNSSQNNRLSKFLLLSKEVLSNPQLLLKLI